ncbi:hypothetical protein [Flavobacterium lacus]|uniref:Uncharacterized protein n=1 Tax=Flavobacterium lacus TaxID=1353778 RepID=A0A328WKJ4_9FLAO|nr:hypothetical protein [Flavobacterium lacus]RAR46872.1 hypothetical protein B0I10_11492 [Flavobacterium lacus]
MKNKIILLLSILTTSSIYSQTEYVEKYENGEIKLKGFVIDSVLIGNYLEYYETRTLKTQVNLKIVNTKPITQKFMSLNAALEIT